MFLYRSEAIRDNPYHTEKKPRKIKFFIGFLIFIFFGTGVLYIFHPGFRISVITVNGLRRTEYEEIQSSVNHLIENKRFGFLPRNNYFFIDSGEIVAVLMQRFNLESVTVKKKFPGTLFIIATERSPVALIRKGDMATAVDINGSIVEKLGLRQTPEEYADLPVIVYPEEGETDKNTEKLIIEGVHAWNNFLKETANISVVQYGVSVRTAGSIETRDGWHLFADFVENRESQFNALNAILMQKKIDLKKIEYIDLRYKGKVFWK